jgi:type IV secretory pathway VirB4 component
MSARRRPASGAVPPAWGWKHASAGRAAHVAAGVEYQATTVQLAGLFPFMAGSGSPALGVPVGRHLLWGEVVALDPLEWLRAGLITNPGMFLLGQPGAGKSALAKRLLVGMTGYGTTALVLGDTKPDYTRLVAHLGGQIIRVGRGLDRINPLDAGPLRTALGRLSGPEADQLRLEIRGRRLSLLLALCTLVRGGPVSNSEQVVLAAAVDLLSERNTSDPTVPDVLAVLEQAPDTLRAAARATTVDDYRRRVDNLVFTLTLLCTGTLQGVFDGPTSHPIDLSAPAVSVDISHVAAAGDALVAAAMLSTWAYAFGVVDAAAVLADQQLAPRRRFFAVMDELWRALRGAPGLVEHADSLTRLNRQRGMASLMITHGLADLEALATEEDRAKATGFIDRAAVKILAALPAVELERVSRIVRLTAPERELVSSWAASEAWLGGASHPGRGKYLLKTGEKPGLPLSMHLVGDEPALYDTDTAITATEEVST